jgi:hypothetical protein
VPETQSAAGGKAGKGYETVTQPEQRLTDSTADFTQSVPLEAGKCINRKGPSWSGDPSKSPRCGAKTRSGKPCRAPAMWSTRTRRYTRCRLHGGASTGPRTPEGLEKCRRANWKHGKRSAEAVAERRAYRFEVRMLMLEMKQLETEVRAWPRRRVRVG